jgi:hypothetical protein
LDSAAEGREVAMTVRPAQLVGLCAALGLSVGCEEINYVRVVSPPALMDGTVTVQGTELRARQAHLRSDSMVETDTELHLPPIEETLVVEREGCRSITVTVPPKLGRTTVTIRPEQIQCAPP